MLDRQIKSWPSIDFEQYPNGIGGTNGAQITGIGSLTEAKDLALVLQSGALPVTFKTLETTAISATLGKDSLTEAWKAAIAGLLVVARVRRIASRSRSSCTTASPDADVMAWWMPSRGV